MSLSSQERFEAIKRSETARLRDEFAMAALQGILASTNPEPNAGVFSVIANDCYRLADEMLKERAK